MAIRVLAQKVKPLSCCDISLTKCTKSVSVMFDPNTFPSGHPTMTSQCNVNPATKTVTRARVRVTTIASTVSTCSTGPRASPAVPTCTVSCATSAVRSVIQPVRAVVMGLVLTRVLEVSGDQLLGC